MEWHPSSTRALLRALRQQGLTVRKTKDGYRVVSPVPEREDVTFHAIERAERARAVKNNLSRLEGLGFIDPTVWRRSEARRKRAEARAMKEAEPMAKDASDDAVRILTPPRTEAPEPPTSFTCPECGKTFPRAASLGVHRRMKHGVAGTSKKHPKKQPERKIPAGMRCDLCGRVFIGPKHLQTHVQRDHPEAAYTDELDEAVELVRKAIGKVLAVKDAEIAQLREQLDEIQDRVLDALAKK